MKDEAAQEAIETQLTRFLTRVKAPRALVLRADERARLEQAAERVYAQLCRGPEPILIVALAGGTGVGKSSLVNALAGSVIAPTSEIRPTTTHIHVYHHRALASGSLPADLVSEAVLVPHDRPELRTKVLVDTPDLDSFVVAHRALTRKLLKAAGLVLYVFSPEKYLEERTWSVIGEEQRFSASAAVLNKIDRVSSPEELALLTADLRRRFASIGLGDVRIFRTCAAAHVPRTDGTLPLALPSTDDTAVLRAFIEQELRASDVTRLWHAQRERVVTHLRDEVERVAPANTLTRCDEVVKTMRHRSADLADRLTHILAEPLATVERELAPLVLLRQHERFWGPFRTWLAMGDFLRLGLPRAVRQLVSGMPRTDASVAKHVLLQSEPRAVEEVLDDAARGVQDLLDAHGLPVECWRRLTTNIAGERLLADLATELDARYQVTTTASLKRGRVVVWLASVLGACVPAALVAAGLYALGRDLLTGTYTGLPLLGHLLATAVLFFLALQGIVSVLLPSTRQLERGMGPQAVQAVVSHTLEAWMNSYRTDLQTDFEDLHEPLAALTAMVTARTETQFAQGRPLL
jgi:energy-coupling factor transporter ATP-binding protein EcfA2